MEVITRLISLLGKLFENPPDSFELTVRGVDEA
jgi:hypothetical protein